MSPELLTLAGITFVAATINGALGYGFSSITVPLALFFFTNRVLNPALVLIEVALNANVLWVNRNQLSRVRRRVTPMIVGLVPGVLLGTWLLTYVNPAWMKLWTYLAVLPLILVQAGGFRRPIAAHVEPKANLAFGSGLGVLYSVTTISGPPLAVMLNNQGFVKQEFRAGLALVRLAESSFTAIAYYFAGIYTIQSLMLIPYIFPGILVGVPLGAFIIHHMSPETFRRICMSFDAWIVGFGTASVLRDLRIVPGPSAYLVLVAVIIIDGCLLCRFFRQRRATRGLARVESPA
jgi:uncharacterized membrane protein YfcA